ncbi:hypothetical protein TrVE_jg4818 [Triparma verrucosa]|uniref:Uncharacterized protein n=1 Tax=Triparma verrucosa TaxID=1606542 RepID=A0A9W7BXX9_9STRA|nr:hypothetical protein TrVE_jg4818 [Triparma verrucosa]
MPTSVANENFEDDDAENEAKQAVNEAGLNGAQSLSWRARMVILRSIFAGAEDVWPKVYDHSKGVAEWMRGPVTEGVNRNYDPLGKMGDAVELLLNQPSLSKFNQNYMPTPKDGCREEW